MQKDQHFRRYSKKSHTWLCKPHCDLDLEVSTPISPHDTPAHDDALPYKVWLQKVERLRRYRPDTRRDEHTDTPKHGHSDSNILTKTSLLRGVGVGGCFTRIARDNKCVFYCIALYWQHISKITHHIAPRLELTEQYPGGRGLIMFIVTTAQR